jgi:hypothetical protein
MRTTRRAERTGTQKITARTVACFAPVLTFAARAGMVARHDWLTHEQSPLYVGECRVGGESQSNNKALSVLTRRMA